MVPELFLVLISLRRSAWPPGNNSPAERCSSCPSSVAYISCMECVRLTKWWASRLGILQEKVFLNFQHAPHVRLAVLFEQEPSKPEKEFIAHRDLVKLLGVLVDGLEHDRQRQESEQTHNTT